MTNNKQWVALYTLIRYECTRMLRMIVQVFLPPVVTSVLYFMIFGEIMGRRIGLMEGVTYSTYIAPGLVLMMVINNSYSNVSISLFQRRFFGSMEELLISPMHNHVILIGYLVGGVIRALMTALLILTVAAFFINTHFIQWPLTLCLIVLISIVFSLAGFTNGLLARNFEDVSLIPTFILTPLTYLGGVFYSIYILPPAWQIVAKLDPILYMVTALRTVMLGQKAHTLWPAIGFMMLLITGLFALNLILLKKGVGLRE